MPHREKRHRKTKSENLYLGSPQQMLTDMIGRVEAYPNDDHLVSLNGDERMITPEMIPDFVKFVRDMITELDAISPATHSRN
jgi:spore coat polysaccharide biosynthesis protein SpsF (cytidylyltransferase family)